MLELRAIRKTFDDNAGGHWLLADGLDLVVAAGQTVAVLGPSGSGKSTLLKIIAGLEAQDGGQVLFDGDDLAGVPTERRRFALMFQDFALFPHLDVQDNVAFGLIEQRVPRAQARTRAREMLALFGLQDRARDRITPLSGGEQQRVALARALITEPRALLLDEPFSALDTDLRARMQTEFGERIRATGMAALLVTHDETEARAMADEAWRLGDGRLEPAW